MRTALTAAILTLTGAAAVAAPVASAYAARKAARLTVTVADDTYPAGLTCDDLTGTLSSFAPFEVEPFDGDEQCETDADCDAVMMQRAATYCAGPLAPIGSNRDFFCSCFFPAYGRR